MKDRPLLQHFALLLAVISLTLATAHSYAQKAPSPSGILNRDQAGPLLPPSVFYHGQVAPIQTRNSAGYRDAGGKLILAGLVDTSGYASSIQQTYQGYLITEVPLRLGDKTLAPGAYGFGFVAPNRMVAMDLGGNEVLSTSTTPDAGLARPNPLQILPDPASPTTFRLYLGRSYVTLAAVSK
jgi:hypothetical protein